MSKKQCQYYECTSSDTQEYDLSEKTNPETVIYCQKHGEEIYPSFPKVNWPKKSLKK